MEREVTLCQQFCPTEMGIHLAIDTELVLKFLWLPCTIKHLQLSFSKLGLVLPL